MVEDLLAIAEAGSGATHYAGTLLTFEQSSAAGVLSTIRVVDGQQRLTTVSILLACIARKLERNGPCGEWTAPLMQERLENRHMSEDKRFKLRLQAGDDEEYRHGLDDNPTGAGAVTQAWRIADRLVKSKDTASLLRGLERFRVVSIGLDPVDDPQQIFETLNATGRPLTESEKIKNWLLVGLREEEQRKLHDDHWQEGIVKALDAAYTTEPIDLFLRDMMRWRTGEVQGGAKTHQQFRHWALRPGADDRPALLRELERLAGLYGILTGAAGEHASGQVEMELRHLRTMGLDVHRPLTLRLLDDASREGATRIGNGELAEILAGIGTWITRLWLADRPLAGMNKAIAELAHSRGPREGENVVEHWLDRIRQLRNQRIGVPSDEQVREGVRTRQAYGRGVTRPTSAVLWRLTKKLPGAPPAPASLDVEHVLPQKLTDAWKRDIGEDAKEIHEQYRHRLENLTLLENRAGFGLGAKPFAEKKVIYRRSMVEMTRRIAHEKEWNEEALMNRAEELASRALERWPWKDRTPCEDGGHAAFQWRIEEYPWSNENAGSQLILHVVAALLDRDPANADKLRGEKYTMDLHPATRYPSDKQLRVVPGHEDWVIYPYAQDYPATAERCRGFGERCGVRVEVIPPGAGTTQRFWKRLQETTGGLPGQHADWQGPNQRVKELNAHKDDIGIGLGDARIHMYGVVDWGSKPDGATRARLRDFSRRMHDQMADQTLDGDPVKSARDGGTVTVMHDWTRDDEGEWDEACNWIQDQYERLRMILADSDRGDADPAGDSANR